MLVWLFLGTNQFLASLQNILIREGNTIFSQ
jgi:hypothetical protein